MQPLILLAWEHGSGRGHLSRLICCAEMILKRGGIPIFAVPPMYMHDPELAKYGKVVATPVIGLAAIAPHRLKYVNSFADILNNIGFTSLDGLTAALAHWQLIFTELEPAAIVLDYSPVAGLAAKLANLRGIRLSSGFEVPSADCPIFAVNKITPEVIANNARMIDKINETLDMVCARMSKGPSVTLSEVLNAHETFITAIPETDTYERNLATTAYIGHMSSHKNLAPVVWPKQEETVGKAFLYARDIGRTKPWLDALLKSNISVLCHAPVGDKKIVDQYKDTCIHISRNPFNLDGILQEADFCINYGSATMVCQTLLAGKPQLMIPSDTEKELIADRVAAANLGIRDGTEPDRFQGQIDRLLSDSVMRSNALAVAAKYPQSVLDTRLEVLAQAIVP